MTTPEYDSNPMLPSIEAAFFSRHTQTYAELSLEPSGMTDVASVTVADLLRQLNELPGDPNEQRLIFHTSLPQEEQRGISGAETPPQQEKIQEEILKFDEDNVVINNAAHTVEVDHKTVYFNLKEYKMLRALAQRIGIVVDFKTIRDEVWDGDTFTNRRTADVTLSRIKAKLGSSALRIKTIQGIGWQIIDDTEIEKLNP